MSHQSACLAIAAVVVISLAVDGPSRAEGPATPGPIRGVLIGAERAADARLREWRSRGINAVIVPLDDLTSRERWTELSKLAAREGLALYAWIEVARNPGLADAHPEWMAALGGHHDDWRRRFPAAPAAKAGEVIKAWPWVPIGYAPALEAHRRRLRALLDGLPGSWAGVFLNDLQGGPSSCGCGNDQCRWALDYGTPATAPRVEGDDAAASIVAELRDRHPGKVIVPVWVTECEPADLPGAKDGTGLCGGVGCAKGDCWPRYVRNWNPLVKASNGPVAVALWSETFRRDPVTWMESGLRLFQAPPKDGTPLTRERAVAVVQAWSRPDAEVNMVLERVRTLSAGWVLALEPIDQSWEPRTVPVAGARR